MIKDQIPLLSQKNVKKHHKIKYLTKTNKFMWKEIKLWLTSVFIMWAFDVCPNGKFKVAFAQFLRDNITDL